MNPSGNNAGTDPGRSHGDDARRPDIDSREGDPRKRDQQDRRTAGPAGERKVRKDDPSRAPESGTP